MNDGSNQLQVLFVDDDVEALEQFRKSLPDQIGGYGIDYDFYNSFEGALDRLRRFRYDLILTDVYMDRGGTSKIDLTDEDATAAEIVKAIRGVRFCPIVCFTSGSKPTIIAEDEFVRFADKGKGNDDIVEKAEVLIKTGVPVIAKMLHDDLDSGAAAYLWQFLNSNWDALQKEAGTSSDVLVRLIRRRAATFLSRSAESDGTLSDLTTVKGVEFYIAPCIGNEFHLGEVLQHKANGDFRVILTPHCYLAVQKNATTPKADFVLTAKTIGAPEVLNNGCKTTKQLRPCLQSPADLGKPNGRYWFLPRLLSLIPDLYCDLLNVESVPLEVLRNDYERIAVLDAPFAEALQSCFQRLYSSVGLPGLDPEEYVHLLGAEAEASSTGTAD